MMDEPRGSITDWNEDDVCLFIANLGYAQHEDALRDNGITGELLLMLDAESLTELGFSVGQRLAILKAIYLVKLAHDIEIGPDDYVPPSEVAEQADDTSVDKLHEMLKSHSSRLLKIEEENRILRTTLNSALEDLNRRLTHPQSQHGGEDSPLARSRSFKWPDFIKPTRSPTKPDHASTSISLDSPQPSPRHAQDSDRSSRMTDSTRASTTSTVIDPRASSQTTTSSTSTVIDPPILSNSSNAGPSTSTSVPNLRPSRQESSDNLKSFKVSLEDPAYKVLPAALKKYKINNDDWQNYAMFICFGAAGARVERCLSYDEKPLLLFQRLKDAKKNPVFMLKHIKDIRSPIQVAQQKHAARKASTSASSSESGSTGPGKPQPTTNANGSTGTGKTVMRPPRLHVTDVHNLNPAAPMTSNPLGTAGQWPELMSPAVENKADGSPEAPEIPGLAPSQPAAPSGHGEMLPAQGVSYAVAIYPYMAEQEDEFDVVVGDTFVILSRARGWWVVQRDDAGTGHVDADTTKQGWVPAGCLLETRLPVASAIAEAASASGSSTPSGVEVDGGKRPILPLSIVSTSFPGTALMDYKGKGEEELDLVKDEGLRVFKRYNHWSYAVKEDSGERGWVPSWYIGKVATEQTQPNGNGTSSGKPVPPSPGSSTFGDGTSATSGGSGTAVSSLETLAQPSPMSSAFPGRTTVVS